MTKTASSKTCYFCDNNMKEVDYKNTGLLRKFVNFHMKILPRKRTGVCAFHQRKLSTAIERSRHMALLDFVNR